MSRLRVTTASPVPSALTFASWPWNSTIAQLVTRLRPPRFGQNDTARDLLDQHCQIRVSVGCDSCSSPANGSTHGSFRVSYYRHVSHNGRVGACRGGGESRPCARPYALSNGGGRLDIGSGNASGRSSNSTWRADVDC